MRHNKWTSAAVILAASLAISACGSNAGAKETTAAETVQTEAAETESSAAAGTEAADTEQADAEGTHEVVDHAGNHVQVPNEIHRVVIDQIPILSTYMAYFEGSAPNIVGYCGSFKDTISETVLKNIAPGAYGVV